MSNGERPKPLFWVGSSKKDLKGFPLPVRRTMGFALFQAQTGGKHMDAKPLKGFGGAGVLEVPVGTVMSRLHYARRKLQACLSALTGA